MKNNNQAGLLHCPCFTNRWFPLSFIMNQLGQQATLLVYCVIQSYLLMLIPS